MKTTGKQEIIVFTIKNIMRSDYIFDIKNNEINKMTKTRALQILEDIATFAKDAGNEEWTKEIEQAEQYIEDHLPDDGYFGASSGNGVRRGVLLVQQDHRSQSRPSVAESNADS